MGAGRRRLIGNRLFIAFAVAMLVWLADQPTVSGYQPLLQMFWDPGLGHLPLRDWAALILSWFVTGLFCHFVMFVLQKVYRARQAGA